MKVILALSSLALFSSNVRAEIKVVYGQDNRQDVYQSTNSLHKTLAKSTAGMIDVRSFYKSSKPGYFNLLTYSLEESANVCPTEAFSQQPTAPTCSGFLVSPDTLVTAGHCYKAFSTPEQACKTFAWVFDYHMTSPSSNPAQNIPITNVYLCKKVISSQLTASLDYTVIKLDRPVVGRAPLKFRKNGILPNNTKLVVIGHPTGLPTKIAGEGKITRNLNATSFSTTLDTFHGNSGSAVFDSNTGLVEGILIQGKTDYAPSIRSNPKSCQIVNRCNDNGGNCLFSEPSELGAGILPNAWGEVVLRISSISKVIDSAIATK